jgi:hypothetical protein
MGYRTADSLGDAGHNSLQAVSEDMMIIISQCVGGQADISLGVTSSGQVVLPHYKDRFAFWQDILRIPSAPEASLRRQVSHLAVQTGPDPTFVDLHMRRRVGRGHPYQLKSNLMSEFLHLGC